MQIVPSIDRWNGGGLLLWNILYSSFLTTTLWDPGCFDSGFLGLLLCAAMGLCKVLYVFLVILKGSCGVGCLMCIMNKHTWCPCGPCSFISLLFSCLHWLGLATPADHGSLCLLCNVAAASAGYSSRCSQLCRCQTCALCSSVCVKVMLPSFKKVICY